MTTRRWFLVVSCAVAASLFSPSTSAQNAAFATFEDDYARAFPDCPWFDVGELSRDSLSPVLPSVLVGATVGPDGGMTNAATIQDSGATPNSNEGSYLPVPVSAELGYQDPPKSPLPGDINGDGHVDSVDLALLLGGWTG